MILPYTSRLELGNDLAGVVVRTGSAVKRFRLGDEVYTRPPEDRDVCRTDCRERKRARAETLES